MLAPISWVMPPAGYGPWERVVYNITEELVKLGHDVTLFAAGGSTSSAHVVHTVPYALETWPDALKHTDRRFDMQTGLLEGPPDPRVLEELHIGICMEQVAANRLDAVNRFDIVHSHLHVHALPYARLIDCPMVSTLHGSTWVRSSHPMFLAYRDLPFVSISNAERQMLPELNYVATVYNGIRLEDFPFVPDKSDDLLFAGRLSPEKGVAEAVEVALRARRRLVIAGPIEPQYQDYYDTRIWPYIDGKNVEYVGTLSQQELAKLYGKAAAVLQLNRWCEPCAMVATEAQACGTPLIATRMGYLPELITDGENGFLVDSIDEAVAAVHKLDQISPAACRRVIEQRFSAAAMGRGYADVYAQLLAQ